jgi:hypothetical protein
MLTLSAPAGIPRTLALLAGAVIISSALSFVFAGLARADDDGIVEQGSVPITEVDSQCVPGGSVAIFSFDISWIDAADRAYFLADRSHGTTPSDTEGGRLKNGTGGDVLMIDIDNPTTATPILPPANDPFAGVRCDANASFGGTFFLGMNEISGPNGLFTVNHSEIWVGDGPSYFTPGQTNAAADYKTDPCNSSVRVIDLISRQQTDHIDLGGCFRTDEGAFDPDDQLALFANPSEQPLAGNPNANALNGSPFISLISTAPVVPGNHHKILKQINFDGTHGTVSADGGIKQAVWSPRMGLFYVAVRGNSANPTGGYVAVVDPGHGDSEHGRGAHGSDIRVVKNFALSNCSPNGAALGPDNELFLGCSAGPEQVIDIRDGHVIATLGTGFCDEVAFNPADDSFYGVCALNSPRNFSVIDIVNADPLAFDGPLRVYGDTNSLASDPVTGTEWVPIPGSYPAFPQCGNALLCVAFYGSNGGDDASEANTDATETHHPTSDPRR